MCIDNESSTSTTSISPLSPPTPKSNWFWVHCKLYHSLVTFHSLSDPKRGGAEVGSGSKRSPSYDIINSIPKTEAITLFICFLFESMYRAIVVVSSPVHEVLMVSYCGQSMSVVRRASCVARRLQLL